MKCLYSPGSNGPECKHCKDDPKKNCQWCNCHICGIKQDPDKQLLCDECDMAYHTYCLNPPLTSIPEDEDWSVGSDAEPHNSLNAYIYPDICLNIKLGNNQACVDLKSHLVAVVAIVTCICRNFSIVLNVYLNNAVPFLMSRTECFNCVYNRVFITNTTF